MPDQLLQRSMVTINQRLDVEDFNRTNDQALANLALALRHFLVPTTGVMRGLTLDATDPTSMLVTLKPGAAIGPNGDAIIVESDRAVGPFAANASGNPRIDLVSIRYAEAAGSAENRNFINPVDGTQFSSAVNTRVITNPTVTITQGVPAADPVAPATPAGDVALYAVRIENGAVSIAQDKLTRVETSRVDPLRVASAGAVIDQSTWDGPSLQLQTPAGMTTFLFAIAGVTVLTAAEMHASIRDVAAGTQLSTYGHAPTTGLLTLTAAAAITGPTVGVRTYRLRVTGTLFDVGSAMLVALTL